MNKTVFSYILIIIMTITLSCNEGDIDLASGTYTLSVVTPDGFNHSGHAYLTQIGNTVTMQLYSDAGNFNYAGELEASTTAVTSRFSAIGADNTEIDVEFSSSRSSFSGSIIYPGDTTSTTQTSVSSVYLVNGTKI